MKKMRSWKRHYMKTCLFHTRITRQGRNLHQAVSNADVNHQDEDGFKTRTFSQTVLEPFCNVPYEKQLESKMRHITEDFMAKWYHVAWNYRLNREKFLPDPKMFDHDIERCRLSVEQILPSPVIDGYRNKTVFAIGPGIDGEEVKLGVVLRGKYPDRKIGCPLSVRSNKKLHNEVVKVHEELMKNSTVPMWSQRNYISGSWRNILVRSSVDEELMIAGVIYHNTNQPNPDNVERAREEFYNFYVHGPGRNLNCKSLHFQATSNRQLYDQMTPFELLHGEPHIYETLKNFKFAISPSTFFQINPAAAEVMYDEVRDIANLDQETTLYDVCCGVGSIGIYLSPYVKRIVGIEGNKQAVQNATSNAEFNGVTNAEFQHYVAKRSSRGSNMVFDPSEDVVAVVNPSRRGLHKNFIAALRRCERIKKVVYISCKPLGRPLYNFIQLTAGESDYLPGTPFKVSKIVPVDMFPHNKHLELLIGFER